MKTGICYGFLIFILVQRALGQSYQQTGLLPSILLKQPINSAWDLGLTVSSELLVSEDEVDGQLFPRKVRNFNLNAAASYDFSPELNFDFGFLFRQMDPFEEKLAFELRPWQQATFQFYTKKFRWRNRLRAEERIFTREGQQSALDWRIRNRISLDFPLSGERLDPGELYMNNSFEAHFRIDEEDVLSNWENRSYVGLGFLFKNRNRIELGPEWRYRRRTDDLNSRIIYWRLVWVSGLDILKKS